MTSRALLALHRLSEFIPVDGAVLNATLSWMLAQQNERDGSFSESLIYPSHLKARQTDLPVEFQRTALSATVMITLLETRNVCEAKNIVWSSL